MKKSKLLLLSTIAPVSIVLPMVATSCNKDEPEMIKAISPKTYEVDVDTTTQINVWLNFEVVNTPYSAEDIQVEVCNQTSYSEYIHIPDLPAEIHQEADHTLSVGFNITKDDDFSEDDYAEFDLKFKNEKESWEQTIEEYSYTVVKDVDYKAEDDLDKKVEVQVTYREQDKQDALKAVDENGQGILEAKTPIGSAFKLKYLKTNAPWGSKSHLKFGSYVNPEQAFVPYHIFYSVSVAVIKSNDSIETLDQTYPSDSTGKNGYWWISEGGPITVISNKLDTDYTDWKGLIFTLKTADEIKNNTSFYITYSNR